MAEPRDIDTTAAIRPNPRDDLFQWVMSVPNPYTGESAWDRMQREAAGEELPQLEPELVGAHARARDAVARGPSTRTRDGRVVDLLGLADDPMTAFRSERAGSQPAVERQRVLEQVTAHIG